MIDFVNFENSTENWNITNMLTIDTGEEINSLYEIPQYYRQLELRQIISKMMRLKYQKISTLNTTKNTMHYFGYSIVTNKNKEI